MSRAEALAKKFGAVRGDGECTEIKATGFSSKADARLDQGFVKAIRDAGFEYHCWTVDDVATARRFFDLGALSVTTNRPEFLRKGLSAAH